MTRHEKYCRLNPQNLHRCFDLCHHLKRERSVDGFHVFTEFTCTKLNIKMYSFLAEKKKTSYFGNPIKIEGLVRMPLQCIYHQYMTFEEQEDRFNSSND
jgi:hypothetical protein